jgi:hypothetical protein
MAAAMLHQERRMIPRETVMKALHVTDIDSLDSIYARLLDENIIIEEGPGLGSPVASFVYDEFFEYLLSRYIARDIAESGGDVSGVERRLAELVLQAKHFPPLFGAVGYLVVILLEESDINMLPIIPLSDSLWQTVMVRALTQVRPAYITEEVIDTIRQLAIAGNDETCERITELLNTLAQANLGAAVDIAGQVVRHVDRVGYVRREASRRLCEMARDGNDAQVLVGRLLKDNDASVRALVLY